MKSTDSDKNKSHRHSDNSNSESNSNDCEGDEEFQGKLLHQSCLWDNYDLLNDLLFGDERRNVNSRDSKGRTALHAAVIANSVDCVRLLASNGADVNIATYGDRRTALHIAAERGGEICGEIVQILIESNANIYAKDANGFTAMDLAEQQHHQQPNQHQNQQQTPVVAILREALVTRENMRTELYESLAIAVHRGDADCVRQLFRDASNIILMHDINDNVDDEHHDDDHDANRSGLSSVVNYAPNGTNTLLFKACQEGHLAIVEMLIDAGADGRQHPVTKYSPLYIAAYHGRTTICERLLSHFPRLVAIFTVEHWLPIHAAAMNNHRDIVRLLLEYRGYSRDVMRRFVCRIDDERSAQRVDGQDVIISSTTDILSSSDLRNVEKKSSVNPISINSNASQIIAQNRGHQQQHHQHTTDNTKSKSNNTHRGQFIYSLPFDANAQDIAGQSLLYLATLLGNEELVDYLLDYRVTAISYTDYFDAATNGQSRIGNLTDIGSAATTSTPQPQSPPETLRIDNFELICNNEADDIRLSCILSSGGDGDHKANPSTLNDNQCDISCSNSSSSGGSSPDITVISNVFDNKLSEKRVNSPAAASASEAIPDSSSSIDSGKNHPETRPTPKSPIQRLIDKLSSSSSSSSTKQEQGSLKKQNEISLIQKSDETNLSIQTKVQASTSNCGDQMNNNNNSKPIALYRICPFQANMYCNYHMETALHCAVKKRHYAIASRLLESGADANLPINCTQPSNPSIITRVSHFNHHFFLPQLSLSNSMQDFRYLTSAATSAVAAGTDISNELLRSSESSSSAIVSNSTTSTSAISTGSKVDKLPETGGANICRASRPSTALREAIRNRDRAMFELLLRFGARDDDSSCAAAAAADDDDDEDEDDDDDGVNESGEYESNQYGYSSTRRAGSGTSTSLRSNALSIAFANGDFHFVSKLLSLKAFADAECKINKRAFDIGGSNCVNALNKFNIVNNLTVSSMFPSKAVMIDWRHLRIKQLDGELHRHLMPWLVDSALLFNVKLKLSQVQELSAPSDNGRPTGWNTALAAITRIDLSYNSLTTVPHCLFTDLPSLKILNLSKNRLQSLPEMDSGLSPLHDSYDDDSVSSTSSSLSSTGGYLRNSGNVPETNQGFKIATAAVAATNSPKSSGYFFSRMRKSQSVTAALSNSPSQSQVGGNTRISRDHHFKRSDSNSRFHVRAEWNLPFLEELYLQDNQLECLPTSLFQQPELKLLDLSNNKLRTLPPLFWFAPKLADLNLSLNLLCDLPSPSQQCSIERSELSESSESISKSITKSISTSSINEIGKNRLSQNSLDRSVAFGEGDVSSTSSSKNLAPFELLLAKPWLSRVNILNDDYHSGIQADAAMIVDDRRANLETDHQQSQQQQQQPQNISKRFATATSDKRDRCRLTQLNLSHNGFERVPFALSCLATGLTHLNLSYNRLTTIFHADYLLGNYPIGLKHLDLSHNLIDDWLSRDELERYETMNSGDEEYFATHRPQCCVHCAQHKAAHRSNASDGNRSICPFKRHYRLEQLKTLVLTKNHLKKIVITRDELFEECDRSRPPSKQSSRNRDHCTDDKKPPLLSRFSKPSNINPLFFGGSTDDLTRRSHRSSESESESASSSVSASGIIKLNAKASRYSKLYFPNLSMLDFSNNQLAEVPKTICYLAQLSVLNLSGNVQLTVLPPEMGLLNKLWNLNTRGCMHLAEPLRSMIISNTYKTCDIISYLNSILENSKPYARMKLMIVGVQGIGKTSLLEQLRHEGISGSGGSGGGASGVVSGGGNLGGGSHRRGSRTPDHWGKRVGNKSMSMKTPRGVTLSTVGVDLHEWTYDRKPLRGARDRERSLSRSRMPAFQVAPAHIYNHHHHQYSGGQKNGPNASKSFAAAESIGAITFRTWDFGGQREYYATHQYFLSKRSIYLVVWKITDGERGIDALHSWLLNIQCRAPNSPVIIVGTHYDLVKEYFPPFFSSDLQNTIRDRYISDAVDADKRGLPRVVASIEVSAKTRHNIRLLANVIYETAAEMRTPGCKERLLDQKVPATYIALEDIVTLLAYERKAADLEPVLLAEQYRNDVVRRLKERHNLAFRDYAELQQATRFLHENGVMLHYEDANLKDLYFLDPQWLCDILAHVVTIREINPFAKNGIMKTDNLLQLFKNTYTAPLDVQNYLLSLMNKFELALTWDNRTLLIPSLLPTEEQLLAGHPGSNISIPLRSRLKMGRSALMMSDAEFGTKFEFKNQIPFPEIQRNRNEHGLIASTNFKTTKAEEGVEVGDGPIVEKPICTITAGVRHLDSIHRILLLSYVPCGFWSRLITRMFADETVIEVVRSFYHLPIDAQNNPTLIALLNNAKAKWLCWQTGFGLRYLDTFLLRVKEFNLTPLSAGNNNTNGSGSDRLNYAGSATNAAAKSYFPYDYNRIKFYLSHSQHQCDMQPAHRAANSQQHSSANTSPSSSSSSNGTTQWSEIHIPPQGSAMVEIYLPAQPLQVDIPTANSGGGGNESSEASCRYILEPNMEMLTKLLVILVEHIDTLLEDWYPSLGTRFIHTSDGRFLITRIVPCTLCMRSFIDETAISDTCSSFNDRNISISASKSGITTAAAVLSPDTAQIDSNLVDFYKSEVKKAATLHATKLESHDSAISTLKITSESANENQAAGGIAIQVATPLSLYHSVYAFMIEECILAVYEDRRLHCPTHGRLRIDKIAPDVMFVDLKENFCIDREQLRFGKLLGRGSFGFVFRAFYTPKKLQPNSNAWKCMTTAAANRESSRVVTNSKFYLSPKRENPESANYQQTNIEVALKLLQPVNVEQWSSGAGGNIAASGIRKPDMEAYAAMKSKWERDPLQYACKAYCTARTELNILASLKHANIASIIGICPKPLALVLTLAPQGSLDAHIKTYRRSGTRIAANVLQCAFLQISKALEYLHQHHIIYRDLKSENVLVWSFPAAAAAATTPTTNAASAEINLKLADYGISRSSLPTGTKGFGGTEGFMAPEIMLHNGEEEYTEKVDCFSFAMFMYELCTLRFPFEGQEFAIRESILDGIRPALSAHDLRQLPELFVDLMVRCWAQEPAERPTISQVVSIISAPEFGSLRDVAYFNENYALICATGYEKKASVGVAENIDARPKQQTPLGAPEFNLGICLSKVGQQIDFLECTDRKWNRVAHKLTCDSVATRTITSACVVAQRYLWLGDSQSRLHLYELDCDMPTNFSPTSVTETPTPSMSPICMIQIEHVDGNPAVYTAISTIRWLPRADLIVIATTSGGQLWLLTLRNLRHELTKSAEADHQMGRSNFCFTSAALRMNQINNNGSMILSVCHIDRPRQATESSPKYSENEQHNVEIWCGQPEGKISIIAVRLEDDGDPTITSNQILLDHYDDKCVKSSNAIYIGSSVPLIDRNDVLTLVAFSADQTASIGAAATNTPYVWSVLHTGFVAYQWDALKRQILNRLDCSKFAPCSESLMSISIEDHLKPGSCQITALACNEDTDELYVGTNSGCIIVAESHSLKPITVFRPYNNEVKFIITFPSLTIEADEDGEHDQDHKVRSEIGDNNTATNAQVSTNCNNSLLRNFSQQVSSTLWHFAKSRNGTKVKEEAAAAASSSSSSAAARSTKTSTYFESQNSSIQRKYSLVQRKPFVTIGRGYRNLLDRFIYTNSTANAAAADAATDSACTGSEKQLSCKNNCKLKDSNNLHIIIWDSGYWNVE